MLIWSKLKKKFLQIVVVDIYQSSVSELDLAIVTYLHFTLEKEQHFCFDIVFVQNEFFLSKTTKIVLKIFKVEI